MPKFKPTPHPILPLPTAAQAAVMGEMKWRENLKMREAIIERERVDPLRYGYEPGIWRIADALLDWPWLDADETAAIREALGFEKRVKTLFILGGNRGGKTEYSGKRTMRTLLEKEQAIAWMFQLTSKQSTATHQKAMWRFMPPEIPKFKKETTTYISYKQKTGFSEDQFVLPNASECWFKNYEMEKDNAIQGPEIDLFVGDELIPPDWVEDLEVRLATRDGRGIVPFTPVQGYSATVKMAQDGAETVLEQTAFLCPKDEGDPDVARALGFEGGEEEMMQVLTEYAHALGFPTIEKMMRKELQAPWSRPTDFRLVDGKIKVCEPAVPEGRRFEKMPRVMKCVNENYAILFFHTSDAPFGNPPAVWGKIRSKGTLHVKERWYGWANKTISCRFPKFSLQVHGIEPEDIPAAGTNYMLLDPAEARNFVMPWLRVLQKSVYVYREWPGYYEVPGEGVPGAWALPDGKKLDGRRGPAQRPFGWGLERYKQEIARLEGWKDAREGVSEEKVRRLEEEARRFGRAVMLPGGAAPVQELGIGQRYDTMAERGVKDWTAEHGAAEKMFERIMDSRPASKPRVSKDVPRTLWTDFEDLGLTFELAPGDSIAEGVALINDALDYDEYAPPSYFNQPHLFVSKACRNTIFALQTWTGADGQKGACKDFIDLLRYFFLRGCEYVEVDEFWETAGGGYY